MEKRKIYIFFTHYMYSIAGTQMYTAGKTLYLAKLGWKVFLCHNDSSKKKPLISSISEYVKSGVGLSVLNIPPYRLSHDDQEKVLNFIIQKFELTDFDNCEIIVESHDDFFAYWAELFAEKIGARHLFFSVHEGYRNIPGKFSLPGRYFEDNLDFFYFKWKRNELISLPILLQKLFNGYKNVEKPLVEMPNTVCELYPIQDVDFPKIEEIPRLDWNICHIGRSAKDYVPYIIEGVGELAKKYPNKTINFIFVGNADSRMELLNETFKNLTNVKLTLLDDLCPIPRILFSKVDVVCAISQSARFAANDGILTICASADVPEKCAGVLGYDTLSQGYGEPIFSYVEAFERVLVKNDYADKKYLLPKLKPAEYYYEKFWAILKEASPEKKYYTERLSQDRVRPWFAPFPFVAVARGTKIILVGATEIAKDYIAQIQCQESCKVEISHDGVKKLDAKFYCDILTTVDEHPENFDNSVVGFDRLKQLDYDAIVLTVYSSEVERIRKKILEIVPQMADRIVCNLQFINTYRMKHKKLKLLED